jgi:hypothetical protein
MKIRGRILTGVNPSDCERPLCPLIAPRISHEHGIFQYLVLNWVLGEKHEVLIGDVLKTLAVAGRIRCAPSHPMNNTTIPCRNHV